MVTLRQLTYKNIIFDLGNVLVKLDEQATMRGFEKLGMDRYEHVRENPKALRLFQGMGIGLVSDREFFDGFRKLTGSQASDEQITEATNAMLRYIPNEKKRIILIAGPSSSGKTSFAKRLCIQLRVCGLRPLYLGTDDYFIDRKDLIPDEKGNIDFETIKALDIDLFTSQMNDLLAGKEVDLPAFDFISGEKKYGSRITKIDASMPIVIEGIHGLNPMLTEGIPEKEKFRIYISPLTSLNIDAHHRIPTTDARMLRRLVRDYRTRNRSAAQTIHDWPSVRRGEDKWIFPYCDDADAFFNSSAIYELSVLKKYAEPLLHSISKGQEEYSEARRMLDFLKFFRTIDDVHEIAINSILREFIGGSILVE